MRSRIFLVSLTTLVLLNIQIAHAQTSEFTYQGKLNTAGSPANGNYDFEFLLFDALNGGVQVGSSLSVNGVTVADGIFSVRLNFPGNPFTGENRYIEVRVRLAGQGGMTTLSPRQLVTSSPYAIKSGTATFATNAGTANNALSLGGVLAGQYVQTSDPRLFNDRAPLPGSQFYIQNTTAAQANSNFFITGTGVANILDAATDNRLRRA